MKPLFAAALLALSSAAQAQTTWQETNFMDEFCMGEVKTILAIRDAIRRGEKFDPSMIDKWVATNTGAIAEKLAKDMTADPTVDDRTFFRRGYTMCMDNARRVLLDAKQGYRTPIEQLR